MFLDGIRRSQILADHLEGHQIFLWHCPIGIGHLAMVVQQSTVTIAQFGAARVVGDRLRNFGRPCDNDCSIIHDLRRDRRNDFIRAIGDFDELQRRVDGGEMAVADASEVMPPKSSG